MHGSHFVLKGSQQDMDAGRRLLSEAADALSGEQLGQLERDARGYPVKLLDVARGFDVPGLLSAWEGSFSVSDPFSCMQTLPCPALLTIHAMHAPCLTGYARHEGSGSFPYELTAELCLQLQHQPRTDGCVVRFTTLAAAQDALQQLGGGIRGKFRYIPMQRP